MLVGLLAALEALGRGGTSNTPPIRWMFGSAGVLTRPAECSETRRGLVFWGHHQLLQGSSTHPPLRHCRAHRRDEMMVLPYATPINGPHGLYMAHLWGSITGKGKKCKIMRSALKCVLGNHLPDDTTRDCYLHHASQRHANLTHEGVHVGGACGWRPSPTEAGECILPPLRTRNTPRSPAMLFEACPCTGNVS